MRAIAGAAALWALATVSSWGSAQSQAECAGPGALGGDGDCAFTWRASLHPSIWMIIAELSWWSATSNANRRSVRCVMAQAMSSRGTR